MANFGLSRPWIAALNTTTGKYSNGFRLSEAISTSVSPQYAEGSLRADNREIEHLKEFKGATVTAGTSRLPIEAKNVLFGHRIGDDGEEISNSGDDGNYVGYAFISAEIINGAKKYMACLILKMKFNEGEDAYETKGDSIAFKTPSLSGNALEIGVAYDGVTAGDWRIKSPLYDTEEEADRWIRLKLNVLEKCALPVASVPGGTYTSTQSVKLETATAGAKIMYTTDGTTPTQKNGTEYKTMIQVTANTGIRAMAYKVGMEDSDIMKQEYFITSSEA